MGISQLKPYLHVFYMRTGMFTLTRKQHAALSLGQDCQWIQWIADLFRFK